MSGEPDFTMTLFEAKTLKVDVENEIGKIIAAFEVRTGAKVEGVELSDNHGGVKYITIKTQL